LIIIFVFLVIGLILATIRALIYYYIAAGLYLYLYKQYDDKLDIAEIQKLTLVVLKLRIKAKRKQHKGKMD